MTAPDAPSPAQATQRLFSRDYLVVAGGTFLFFVTFGMTLPVLPRYVVALGHGDVAVGVVFGAYALAAVAVRPLIGRVGDRHGRRVLILSGAILTAAGLAGHLVADTVTLLIVMRLLAGAGQAAVIVGFATLALDLAPPARQGEASSYVLVALHIGIGSGPLLGELLLDVGSFETVWIAASLGALVSLLASWALPREPRREVIVPTGLFHPAALRPGIVVGLGSLGFLGFLAFLPLYGEEIGLLQVAPVFLLSSFTIAVVRTASAKVPDRIGAISGATLAMSLIAVALVAMGLFGTPAGLYVTTVVMASGAALFAPSMILAAVQGVPAGERARVIATFTMFMDIAAALGPSLLGIVASRTGYGPTFIVAGGAAALGLLLLRLWLAPALIARAAMQASRT